MLFSSKMPNVMVARCVRTNQWAEEMSTSVTKVIKKLSRATLIEKLPVTLNSVLFVMFAETAVKTIVIRFCLIFVGSLVFSLKNRRAVADTFVFFTKCTKSVVSFMFFCLALLIQLVNCYR